MSDSILVVEDDDDVRAVLVETLVSEGHDVSASEFGPLPDHDFDLVVTDVPTWPYQSDETRRWIRYLRQRYTGVRIILCTAQRFVHREADRLGADLILDQPFDLEDLFGRVAGLLRLRASTRKPALFATGAE